MKKLAILIILSTLSFCAFSRTIYVDANGTGDYPTIQTAIDNAVNDDEIVLAPGTYTGDGNRDITITDKSLTISSTDPNDSTVVENTVIDCNASSSDNHRAFSIESSCTIKGLKIINGYIDYHGGAIITEKCDYINLENCIIKNNTGTEGGAVYTFDVINVKFNKCEISQNNAKYGGGVYINDKLGNPVVNYSFESCRFVNNYAKKNGGGCVISASSGYAKFRNCLIKGCKAIGACAIQTKCNTEIINCAIIGNSALPEVFPYYRNGIIDCHLLKELINTIIWSNEGIGHYGGDLFGEYYPQKVAFCNIQDGWEGIGNIDVEPKLTPDGHLTSDSPCINAGTDVNAPVIDIDGEARPEGIATDIGADEFIDTDGDKLPDWW